MCGEQSGVLISCTRRLSPLLVALALGLTGVEGSLNLGPAMAKATSRVALKVRRYPGRVDVVVAGVGPTARVVSQRTSDSRWTGHIQGMTEVMGLEQPQQLSLPDVGCRPFASHHPKWRRTHVETSESSSLNIPRHVGWNGCDCELQTPEQITCGQWTSI